MYVLGGTDFPIDYVNDVLLTAYLPDSSSVLPCQKFSTTATATSSSEILAYHGVNGTNGILSPTAILLDHVFVVLATPQLNLSLSPTGAMVFTWTSATDGYQLQANWR